MGCNGGGGCGRKLGAVADEKPQKKAFTSNVQGTENYKRSISIRKSKMEKKNGVTGKNEQGI